MNGEQGGHENNSSQHQPEGLRAGNASGALESATRHVAAGTRAGEPHDDSGKRFAAAFSSFVDWAIANALLIEESSLEFLGRAPDAFGREHEAWFDEPTNRWFKATRHNAFGLAWGRDGSAHADEYLVRLGLQNEHFGDDVQLVGLAKCGQRLRVITSQPHIAGVPASQAEIDNWFTALGFSRLVHESGSVAWYSRNLDLLAADAHQGNVIKSRDGNLFPIDLNLVRPVGPLREWAVQASRPQ